MPSRGVSEAAGSVPPCWIGHFRCGHRLSVRVRRMGEVLLFF